jgi:predicted AlkP superfamily pyrophosphatase or phosphodiesterase
MMRRVALISIVAISACKDPAPASKAPPIAVKSEAPRPAPVPVAAPAPAAPAIPTDEQIHVVIVSVDGLRPDMITEDIMPRHVQLMKQGVTARVASTIQLSDTLPSHAAMLSGRGVKAHGLSWNSYKENRGYIKVPTVFSEARKHGLSTAMIVGKQKLRHIAGPESVDYFERPSYLCGGVATRAGAYFHEHQPDLLFVHFSDPDEYGHSHGWMSKEYILAAHHSDACLGKILDAIEASPIAASTLVIVTADHGGEAKNHSNGREAVNSHIPWIARGPGIKPGTVIEEPVITYDTAATTLAALGLAQLPDMAGVSRIEFPHAVVR